MCFLLPHNLDNLQTKGLLEERIRKAKSHFVCLRQLLVYLASQLALFTFVAIIPLLCATAGHFSINIYLSSVVSNAQIYDNKGVFSFAF